MPFLSFLPAIKYFGHFQNPYTLVVDIHLLSAVDFAMGIGRCMNDDLLNELMQDTGCQLRDKLLFLVDNTAHLLAQLEAGELDFVVLEGVFNKERYDSFLLRPEPYIGICSAMHPLAGHRASIEELFDQRLILREEGSGTRRILEYELAQQGYRTTSFPHRACVSSFKLIKELVRSGYGISFLYEAVVKNDPSFGRFFCPPLTGMHDLNVVFLQNTDAGRLARQFLAR